MIPLAPGPGRSPAPFLFPLLALVLAGCGGSTDTPESESESVPGSGGDPAFGPSAGTGEVRENAKAGPDESKRFLVDPNQGGLASEIRLAEVSWGRLVDVYSVTAKGHRLLQQKHFVIAQEVGTDGVDYVLETNAITQQSDLVILRDVSDTSPGGGRDQFIALLQLAETNLIPVADVGLPDAPGFWTMVPRNATVVLRFDDLLDADTVTADNVQTHVGVPPVLPFQARVLADGNHGEWAIHAGDLEREFYTTRVLIDVTVSELESLSHPSPLPVNNVGLPPGLDALTANVAVRVPTVLAPPFQTTLLRNPAGGPVASTNNGTVDFSSPTRDVVRGARSGGPTDVTSDPFDGFLLDVEPPRVVGATPVTIQQAPLANPNGDALDFEIPLMTFDAPGCAKTPKPGDVLTQPGFVMVVNGRSAAHQAGTVHRVRVRLVLGDPSAWVASAVGPAEYSMPFQTPLFAGREECFVRVTPAAGGFPADPAQGIDPAAIVGLRFSEPVRAGVGAPSDGLFLSRVPPDRVASGFDLVPAQLLTSADGLTASVVPLLPLTHATGNAESYTLNLALGSFGLRDLAGSSIAEGPESIELTVEPAAASWTTGGHVSRFSAADEDPPIGDAFDPKPEWSGQHLYDLVRGRIRPRPVVRFESVVDRNQPLPGLMTPFAPGVAGAPLNALGSKTQSLWRYPDVGFDLFDPAAHNLDVEGLAWSPLGGVVVADHFPQFEIALTHARWIPDEYIDPASLFPATPNSGLNQVFETNALSPVPNPPEVVHHRSLGYTIHPGDLYGSPLGTPLMPYPWNEGVAADERTTYTWRDTSLRKRAGDKVLGVPLHQEYFALGLPLPNNKFNRENAVQTIGLPLLVEFRCFPDSLALGINAFDVSLATTSSAKPYFRAFSSGGVDWQGNLVYVHPDAETKANGGFNPASNPPGAPTFGLDNVFYLGSMDFVVRVSRSHSVWRPAVHPAGGVLSAPVYTEPVLEPGADRQPAGTGIAVHFRGMTAFTPPPDSCTGGPNTDALEDALAIDLYGDHYDDNCIPPGGIANHNPTRENVGIAFLNGDDRWKGDVAAIATAPYYQVRLTFSADVESGRTPVLGTFALGWSE